MADQTCLGVWVSAWRPGGHTSLGTPEPTMNQIWTRVPPSYCRQHKLPTGSSGPYWWWEGYALFSLCLPPWWTERSPSARRAFPPNFSLCPKEKRLSRAVHSLFKKSNRASNSLGGTLLTKQLAGLKKTVSSALVNFSRKARALLPPCALSSSTLGLLLSSHRFLFTCILKFSLIPWPGGGGIPWVLSILHGH